jgi:2-dehydropantoate 2-reductase
MAEVAAVARARGIDLGAGAVQDAIDFSWDLGEVKTSMLLDLERGKPLEREALNGVVVRYGRAAGVPTPVQDTLFAALTLLDPAAAPVARLSR